MIGKPIVDSGWDHCYSVPPPKDIGSVPSTKETDSVRPPKDIGSEPPTKKTDSVPPPKDTDSLPPPKNINSLISNKNSDTLPPPKKTDSACPEDKNEKSPVKMEVDNPSSLLENGTVPAEKVVTKEDIPSKQGGVSMETPKGMMNGDVEMSQTSSPKPVIVKSNLTKFSKTKKGNNSVFEGKITKKTPEYTESNKELGLAKVLDTRKCQLCCCYGDDKPSMAGRLLYCGLDEWVHVNCGLWSAEVFEDDDKLQNVQAAITRGKQMVSILL